jgi:hypothetical protein
MFFRNLIPLPSVAISLLLAMGSYSLSAEPVVVEKETMGKVYECKAGPWGTLLYYYVYLEAPADFVEHISLPNSTIKWSFPGATLEDLRALFTEAGLGHAFQEYLLHPDRMVVENEAEGMITVFPPLAQLEAMTPEQRLVIYAELGKHDINEFHKAPVLVTSGSVDDWLGGSKLRPELIEVIRRLTYKRGEVLAFSDLSAVLNYVQSEQEALDFFKTTTRTRTMIMRLELDQASDINKLADYWTGYKRYKDIAPILKSVSETEGVSRLDVIHLLPSMARRFLYSYPSIDLGAEGRLPDCHWTSLNFFNLRPKDYYLDVRLAASNLMTEYDKVEPPYAFGDVLVYLDEETGNAMHSCVQVADDIVFTKNGENLVAPWVLMKMDEVNKVYFYNRKGTIQGYRLKNKKQAGQ